MRRLSRELVTLEADGPRVGRQRAGEEVEDRALARAVGPDQPDDLAPLDRERDVVHGGEAAEALGQPLDGQHGAITRSAAPPRHSAA